MSTQSNLGSSLPPAQRLDTETRHYAPPHRMPLTTASTAELVRPLGAYERVFHRFMEVFPMHFSLAAELAGSFGPEQLRQALVAVQHRHPLLSVHLEDHPGTRLGYYRPAVVPPIPLAVLDTDWSWEQVAAEELVTPFDPATAPLLRVVLLRQGPAAATLVLTFDHTIADGKSAVFVLQDIVTVLNGQPLSVLPVPPARETLLARQPAPAGGPAEVPGAPAPDWLMAPGTLRPFDGARPAVTSLAFSKSLTSQLVQRCRAEQTTVHAALVAAASLVLGSVGQRQHVRVMSPIDIRELLGVERDCAMYFNSTRTAYSAEQPQAFWEVARATSAQLTPGRAEPMTRFIAAMMEQLIPVEAEHDAAKNLFTGGNSFELFISNLGRLDIPETGLIRPTAIWGPVILTQLQGELSLGVATLHGQLRLVNTSHAPIPDFLVLIQDLLATQLSEAGKGSEVTGEVGELRG
jgi:hypothetical protein